MGGKAGGDWLLLLCESYIICFIIRLLIFSNPTLLQYFKFKIISLH